jgi:hypothetical protein
MLGDAVVLAELVLLPGESIGAGWRCRLLLVHTVVLVELVLLLGEEASALVGDGYCCCWVMHWHSSSWCFSSGRKHRRLVGEGYCCCWVMQWCSSSWCFSSGRKHRLWLAMVTAAGACSGARRAGASPRGGSIGVGGRWLLLLPGAVVLVELVLLLGEEASALMGDVDCCWVVQ